MGRDDQFTAMLQRSSWHDQMASCRLAARRSGNVLHLINEVTLRWARLVYG